MRAKWNEVSKQAKNALNHMKSEGGGFNSPVGVGLLIVRVSRKVTVRKNLEDEKKKSVQALKDLVHEIGELTKADFLAHYEAPDEMQVSTGWGKSGGEYRIFPGVIIAAVVHGNASKGNSM